MGGGDLNSKKAWHPNTMKNQERVWKAEQAAAEEKKKIAELERERAQERDRDELNKLSRQNMYSKNEAQSDQLHWMYNKPDKKAHNEDYLLGKSIEKNFDSDMKSEPNEIPAVSRRVVGSSMTTSTSDNVQVDLARKLREDPLLLVKERERAARAALLNNPVQRRKLTELLRKEQEQRKAKSESSTKKKKKSDIDELLTEKLNALGGGQVDLAKLLASDDSSSDSSSEEDKKKSKKKKKKKDKKKKKKKQKYDSETELSSKRKEKHKSDKTRIKDNIEGTDSSKRNNRIGDEERISSSKKRYSAKNSDEDEPDRKHKRNESPIKHTDSERQKDKTYRSRKSYYHNTNNSDSDEPNRRYKRDRSPIKKSDSERLKDKHYHDSKNSYHSRQDNYYEKKSSNFDKGARKKVSLTEAEKAARLAEMTAAGQEREVERGERVAKQLLEMAADDKNVARPRSSKHSDARALPDSLEDRIHSNRHYIQRDRRHMNENFARR